MLGKKDYRTKIENVSRRRWMKAAGTTFILSVTPKALALAPAKVISVRIWPAEEYTRLTLESSATIKFTQFLLGNPDRLVVDLEGVELNTELNSIVSKLQHNDPYIKVLRVGQFKPDVVRLVIDLKSAVKPQLFTLNPVAEYKNRLVIDLYPEHAKDPLMALLAHPQPSNKVESVTKGTTKDDFPEETISKNAMQVKRVITVVLDPGHGGEDPGAVGRAGNHEKTVVLAIAKKLRALLEKEPNIKVVMTREADFFVPLGQRVHKARAVNGDIFMSIHADAFIKPEANGSSVFALSDRGATSAAAKWLAQKENNADLIGGVKVNTADRYLAHTILDLTQTATINDSLKFGKLVLNEIKNINRLHKPAVEQASFAVLKSPDIPSILVETAFISNPEEERQLIDPDYQQRMAKMLFNGIKRYLEKNPPLARTKLA
jgi:N-acetylmuramoyl-L-alanine amidase